MLNLFSMDLNILHHNYDSFSNNGFDYESGLGLSIYLDKIINKLKKNKVSD